MLPLQETSAAVTEAWIVRHTPNPEARLRLFCFPFAGGGATGFRDWANYLSPEIEVCAIQLPGRENRLKEAPFSQMDALTEALTNVLLPDLDRPFIFFGHSMGALVAFALAHRLRAQQQHTPAALLLSGRRPPQIASPVIAIDQISTATFVAGLRSLEGIPAEVLEHPEILDLMLPTIRADFTVCETYTYTPAPPFDCPITVFGGADDPIVDRDKLAEWQVHTSQDFRLYVFPGKHFFIQHFNTLVLQKVAQEINRVVY